MITNTAMILIGGMGSRLGPLTKDIPKPMLEVAGRPFVCFLLERLREQGIERVILCSGFKHERVLEFFDGAGSQDIEIIHSIERDLLGTGGAIKQGLNSVDRDHVFVLNGDSYCRFDLRRLSDFHLMNSALISMTLLKAESGRRYGSVKLNRSKRVVGFAEKGINTGPVLINAGVYIFDVRVFDSFSDGDRFSLERNVLEESVDGGMFGMEIDNSFFIDIGLPSSFNRAQVLFETSGNWSKP